VDKYFPPESERKTRIGVENCVYHASKGLVNRAQLRSRFHEVNPSISRMIINENNIIFMTTLCSKRSRAPYIRMGMIKRFSSMGISNRIWELYLFPKLTTFTMETRLDGCGT